MGPSVLWLGRSTGRRGQRFPPGRKGSSSVSSIYPLLGPLLRAGNVPPDIRQDIGRLAQQLRDLRAVPPLLTGRMAAAAWLLFRLGQQGRECQELFDQILLWAGAHRREVRACGQLPGASLNVTHIDCPSSLTRQLPRLAKQMPYPIHIKTAK